MCGQVIASIGNQRSGRCLDGLAVCAVDTDEIMVLGETRSTRHDLNFVLHILQASFIWRDYSFEDMSVSVVDLVLGGDNIDESITT